MGTVNGIPEGFELCVECGCKYPEATLSEGSGGLYCTDAERCIRFKRLRHEALEEFEAPTLWDQVVSYKAVFRRSQKALDRAALTKWKRRKVGKRRECGGCGKDIIQGKGRIKRYCERSCRSIKVSK